MRIVAASPVRIARGVLSAMGLCCAAAGVQDGTSAPTTEDPKRFMGLNLEELANIPVSSVSKREEQLQTIPAAVAVVTGEDIRRTGVTTIPDALRLAPGVQVAQVNSGEWAVSIRGFNDTYANKLLVLMDGRSVYTPLFSGTFWQAQDPLLQDIDQIEVIRGPGGTVWGANAVNGVVNVVSKSAQETQGLLVSGGGGTHDRALADLRYGGRISDEWAYRVYGKYSLREGLETLEGEPGYNDWYSLHGGFRTDWARPGGGGLTFQGDVYTVNAEDVAEQSSLLPPYLEETRQKTEHQGCNILARWAQPLGETGELKVQAYYDYTSLDYVYLTEDRHTFDFDARHRFTWGSRQAITWGGGLRSTRSDDVSSFVLSLDPEEQTVDTYNVFVQDELDVLPEQLRLTLGTKVEHNDYTGLELEPGVRLAWLAQEHHTLWLAAARAVRTPSDLEDHGRVNLTVQPPYPGNPIPTLVSLLSNEAVESETVIAYELGYRGRLSPNLTFDLALFVNDYDDLRGSLPQAPSIATAPIPHVLVSSLSGNYAQALTYGGELAASWQAMDRLRFQAAYSLFLSELDVDPGANSLDLATDTSSPTHTAYLRSMLDLPHHFDLDLWLRYVDSVEAVASLAPAQVVITIPAYVTLDARLSWRPHDNWEFTVAGRNLLGTHEEFRPTFVSSEPTQVGPSVYARVTFRY